MGVVEEEDSVMVEVVAVAIKSVEEGICENEEGVAAVFVSFANDPPPLVSIPLMLLLSPFLDRFVFNTAIMTIIITDISVIVNVKTVIFCLLDIPLNIAPFAFNEWGLWDLKTELTTASCLWSIHYWRSQPQCFSKS